MFLLCVCQNSCCSIFFFPPWLSFWISVDPWPQSWLKNVSYKEIYKQCKEIYIFVGSTTTYIHDFVLCILGVMFNTEVSGEYCQLVFYNCSCKIYILDEVLMYIYNMQLLSGGKHDFDVDDLRSNTRYTGGYSEGSRTVKLFWEVEIYKKYQTTLDHCHNFVAYFFFFQLLSFKYDITICFTISWFFCIVLKFMLFFLIKQ